MRSAHEAAMPDEGKDPMNDLTDRIDALEMRVAYQDETIETLNSTITDQWKRIDELSRQIARLADRLEQTEAREQPAPSEKPPHY
jgi:SlyX protein